MNARGAELAQARDDAVGVLVGPALVVRVVQQPRDPPLVRVFALAHRQRVLKRFQERGFAAKVERDEILRGCELFGATLADHVAFVIDALRPFAAELRLDGAAGARRHAVAASR